MLLEPPSALDERTLFEVTTLATVDVTEAVPVTVTGMLAGIWATVSVWVSAPPVAPIPVSFIPLVVVRRLALEPPIASAPAGTRPRKSGRLNVVLISAKSVACAPRKADS